MARALLAGHLVGYPTEGVFGLGCLAFDTDALKRLTALKRRSPAKGLILLFGDVRDVQGLLAPLPAARRATVLSSWPGPVTWLLPAPGSLPELLRGGGDRVAVRVTAHPAARALCREVRERLQRAPGNGQRWSVDAGPGILLGASGRLRAGVVSTSANLSGAPALRTAASVRLAFGRSLGAVLPGRLPAGGQPTAVIDAMSGRVVRRAAAWPPAEPLDPQPETRDR